MNIGININAVAGAKIEMKLSQLELFGIGATIFFIICGIITICCYCHRKSKRAAARQKIAEEEARQQQYKNVWSGKGQVNNESLLSSEQS